LPHQKIFFTTIEYGSCYHLVNKNLFELNNRTEVLLLTGIANPEPLKKLVEDYSKTYTLAQYTDHYIFTIDDLKDITGRFEAIESKEKIILTTEKDAVRLAKFASELKELPVYVIPVRHHFLFEEGKLFNETVETFIKNFKKLIK